MKRTAKKDPLLGRWRIVETEVWDADALDLIGPAHITFGDDRLGEIQMIAIGAAVDYRVLEREGERRIEFSWFGYDDSDQASGRGWARLDGDLLTGEIFIHQGDDTTFVARKEASRPKVRHGRQAF